MKIIGKVVGINTSGDLLNIIINDKDSNSYNLKIDESLGINITINDVYEFEYEEKENSTRTLNVITNIKNIRDFDYYNKIDNLKIFYKSSPYTVKEAEDIINSYIEKIENKILKDIVVYLLKKYHNDYFIYPAATKMHHNYIGGLAYHIIGMLKLSDGMLDTYKYINKDYVYAGIILHDIAKVDELTDAINPQYSDQGQLVGHLVMGALDVKLAAKELGYSDTEEEMILIHILISHHGIPQFGAAKKPMVAEAMLIWYIDSIDSKFRVLEEELSNTKEKEFTGAIGVIEKTKIYKI